MDLSLHVVSLIASEGHHHVVLLYDDIDFDENISDHKLDHGMTKKKRTLGMDYFWSLDVCSLVPLADTNQLMQSDFHQRCFDANKRDDKARVSPRRQGNQEGQPTRLVWSDTTSRGTPSTDVYLCIHPAQEEAAPPHEP